MISLTKHSVQVIKRKHVNYIIRCLASTSQKSVSNIDRLQNQNSNTLGLEVSSRDSLQKDMPVSDMQNPFQRDKAQCILCKHKIKLDYKNVKLLSQFVSPYTGRIYGRHITGLCATQQKLVEEEILKSQNAGFMAYYLKQVEFLKDPKLFNPERPIRNHRF